MIPYSSRLLPAVSLCLALAGCSTYNTLDSSRCVNGVDETEGKYGQPYYLPKTLMRLTIRPAGKGGEESKPAAATNVNTVTGGPVTVTVGGEKVVPGAAGAQQPTPVLAGPGAVVGNARPSTPPTTTTPAADPPPGSIKYVITLTTETVPDYASGVLYLKQTPNWFYSEETKIAVNEKNLLTTTDTTSSDRTAQVIYNLADTAANITKALMASMDVGGGSGARARGVVKDVRYKTLNIDVRFDPFDETERRKVQALFGDSATSAKGVRYISPLDILFRWPGGGKTPVSRGKAPTRKNGIFFRDPMTLEVVISGRERQMLDAVDVNSMALRESLKAAKDAAASAKNALDRNTEALKPEALSAEAALTQKKVETIKARLEAEAALLQAAKQEKQLVAEDLQKANDTLETTEDRLLSSTEHHAETIAVPVLNKNRVFAYDIARSAFVQGKKHNLTITDGTLRGVTKFKPSEAEGFTEIPLRLSEKLLAFPKDLLTFRSEVSTKTADSLKSRTNAVNEQKNLTKALESQELEQETARLQAEKANVEAQLQLLQKQKELQAATP